MRFSAEIGDIEMVVTYSFTPEVKPRINCLPDDAHPGESAEIEIESVMAKGIDYRHMLKKSVLDELEKQALNHAVNSAIDDAEQRADFERSQREEY